MNTLELLLSVFISPWQFFKESAPSPSIEVNLLQSQEDQSVNWKEFPLRPDSLSWVDLMKSLFYNSFWNESIYIMDCAERLIVSSSCGDEAEIMQRIKRRLQGHVASHLQFRLVFIARIDNQLQSDVLFTSRVEELC